MLTSTPRFAILAAVGLLIVFTGPPILRWMAAGELHHSRVQASAIAGSLVFAFALLPLFVRGFLRLATASGALAAPFTAPASRRRLADIITVAIWAIWVAGTIIALPFAWADHG